MSLSHRRDFLRIALGLTGGLLSQQLVAAETETSPESAIWLTPDDLEYNAAISTYNAAIHLKPAIVALCKTDAHVREAIHRATEKNLPVAVKSGGHSFTGFCLNDGGVVVDVSRMSKLQLDMATGVLTAGSGCRLAEVNQMLLSKDRLLPSGSCATVGLSGLVLGGGYGFFARQFGLTCDHLVSLRMIDGNGRTHDTSDDPELLWACRGGGNGNFGVVTEMRLQTRPAPKAFRAIKLHVSALTESAAILAAKTWFEVSAGLSDNAFSAFVLNGHTLNILATTTGDMDDDGMVAFIKVLTDLGLKQTSSNVLTPAQALPRYYGRTGPIPFKNGSAGYYQSFDDLAPALPGVISELFTVPGLIFQINTLGGAIARESDGAYPHRAYPWLGEWQSYWNDERHRDTVLAGAARMREHLHQAGISRHYANYPDIDLVNWPSAYYDKNYARLQTVKRRLDPTNRIRHPQSVTA